MTELSEIAPQLSEELFPQFEFPIGKFHTSARWLFDNVEQIPSEVLVELGISHTVDDGIETLSLAANLPYESYGRLTFSDLPRVDKSPDAVKIPGMIKVSRPAGANDLSTLLIDIRRQDGEPMPTVRFEPVGDEAIHALVVVRDGKLMQVGALNKNDVPIPVEFDWQDPKAVLVGVGTLFMKRQRQIGEDSRVPLSVQKSVFDGKGRVAGLKVRDSQSG